MSETKSDKSEEPSKKLSDDFNFQQMNESEFRGREILPRNDDCSQAHLTFEVFHQTNKLLTDSIQKTIFNGFVCSSNCVSLKIYLSQLFLFSEPSIIHVVLLNRTVRILFALGIFCTLLPIVDYFYFYSTEIAEYHIDDSGICSHYPIYQIPCGGEVSDFTFL